LLSTEEIAFAANADALITKNRIIQTVYEMFGRLADDYRITTSQTGFSKIITEPHPKISKGENYLGLPWVMLDYPRKFANPDIFAIRTMFWWGNFFSLQLLFQGAYLQMLDTSAILKIPGTENWFFCNSNDPWQHHFSADYMQPLLLVTPEIIDFQIRENGFVKIGTKLPVTDWQNAAEFLKKSFSNMLQIITTMPPVTSHAANMPKI
jgi:hypothetical protein